MKLPSVTVSRRWLSRLFEVLSPIETGLAAVALSALVFYFEARGVVAVESVALAGIVAAVLGMALVLFQALALAACDLLRRVEFRQHAEHAQKVSDAREKKGFRSFKPEGTKLSLRERARMGDPSAARRIGRA